ncbi:MAG: prepilin-type N-terminal cleavage/methylation domain-containing protein [Desulfobacterales bacterium]|nr:prepilin-type N-terminal cleavage/methylation domain-containing protein [Desulfobacterales bacterium]
MKKQKVFNNQKGFTLIEVIAVLILLGILAAVAVPKYMDLTTDARKNAVAAAIGEVKGNLSLAYGKFLLQSGTPPTTNAQRNQIRDMVSGGTNTFTMGDFTVNFANVAGTATTQPGIRIQIYQMRTYVFTAAERTAMQETWYFPTTV